MFNGCLWEWGNATHYSQGVCRRSQQFHIYEILKHTTSGSKNTVHTSSICKRVRVGAQYIMGSTGPPRLLMLLLSQSNNIHANQRLLLGKRGKQGWSLFPVSGQTTVLAQMIRYHVVLLSNRENRSSVLNDNNSIDLNQGRHHISSDMDEEAVSDSLFSRYE